MMKAPIVWLKRPSGIAMLRSAMYIGSGKELLYFLSWSMSIAEKREVWLTTEAMIGISTKIVLLLG